MEAQPTFIVGEWEVDPARDLLSRGGESVKIERRAMEVLAFLADRAGQVVTQRDLEAAVWRNVVVTPQSVYQAVAQLRRVLGDDARRPRYIETVPRRGYRLVAAVRSPEAEPPAPSASLERRRRISRGWLAVPVVVMAVAGAILAGARLLQPENPGTGPATRSATIAVLDFEELDAEDAGGYLAEAITEELTAALGQVDGLRVAARNSVRVATGESTDPKRIGEQLKVAHLLTGSVRRIEGRVRVSATLVDVGTGFVAWSRIFERSPDALLQLPSDIASPVADSLRLTRIGNSGVGGSRRGTRSGEAYDYYILGQHRANERTSFSLAEAERHLEAAIAADPEFAAAYAALADVYIAEFYYANRPRAEAFELATPLLERAVELDARFGPALALKGLILLETGDYPRASEQLTEAVRLAPSDAKAYLWLGGALFAQGLLEPALAAFDSGIAIDPLNFILHGRRAVLLQSMGRAETADLSAQRAVALAPGHPNPRWVLGLLAMWRGDTAGAIGQMETALALSPGRSDLRVELAALQLDAGQRKAAMDSLADAAGRARGSDTYLSATAMQAIATGDRAALPGLAETLASVDPGNLFLLRQAASLMAIAGEYALAIELFDRAVAINRKATFNDLRAVCSSMYSAAPKLGYAYMQSGRDVEAHAVINDFEDFLDSAEHSGLRCWGTHYQRALVATLRGQPEEAGRRLELAHAEGWRRAWWLEVDPILAPLNEQIAARDGSGAPDHE
jgi:DNA-binding winged helix-turn-helix (wHTH) protein/TolB-like protein/tetratricopeptide (TPR) repeat protein